MLTELVLATTLQYAPLAHTQSPTLNKPHIEQKPQERPIPEEQTMYLQIKALREDAPEYIQAFTEKIIPIKTKKSYVTNKIITSNTQYHNSTKKCNLNHRRHGNYQLRN